MNTGKTPDELLATARNTPLPLSYDEVVQQFLNPGPLPAPQSWWQRRRVHLKSFIMLSLLLFTILYFLPGNESFVSPDLTAFPVAEIIYNAAPVGPLPSQDVLPVVTSPNIRFATLRANVVAPPTVLVAVPLRPDTATGSSPEKLVEEEAEDTHPVFLSSSATTELPPALFTGEYTIEKDYLTLSFELAPDSPTNLLFFDITEDERRSVKSAASTLTLRREAGSLLLYPDGKAGRFEFFSDDNYRAKMTAKGWGVPELLDDEAFVSITEGKSVPDAQSINERAVDQLWFRYFTNNINEDYVRRLQSFGYTTNDLADLWKLANWGLKNTELKETLELSAAVLTDRPPLMKLYTVSYERDELKKFQRNGDRLSFADFRDGKRISDIKEPLGGTEKAELSEAGDSQFKEPLRWENDLNFSLDRPGTTSDTIAYTLGEALVLEGNFEYRYTKDPNHSYVVVFGPEKAIKKMKRQSSYDELKIVHRNKRNPLFIMLPLGVNMLHKPSNGVTIEVKTKRPAKQ